MLPVQDFLAFSGCTPAGLLCCVLSVVFMVSIPGFGSHRNWRESQRYSAGLAHSRLFVRPLSARVSEQLFQTELIVQPVPVYVVKIDITP